MIVPAAPILVSLIDLVIAGSILFAMMAWYAFWPTWRIVTLPAFVALAARRRRTTPELTDPGFEATDVDFSEAEGWLVLQRGRVRVAMNFAAEPRRIAVPAAALLLATDDAAELDGGYLDLPGHSAVVATE